MTRFFERSLTLSLVCWFAVLTGCGDRIPDLVPVTAIVKTPDGTPVSHLQLRFVPQNNDLDGNFIANGVTDEEGKCVLTLPGRDESAIPACTHKVLIVEAPESEEARKAYMSGDPTLIEQELAERKGRPIDRKYSTLQETPLIIEISADKPELEIVLD